MNDIKNIYNINILIEKALQYYDMKLQEYSKYINSNESVLNKEDTSIVFADIDKTKFNYEYIGTFDNVNSVWMWAWMIPYFTTNETTIVRQLLNYGLKINPDNDGKISNDKLYLKTQLVNSRFLLQDEFQLDLHLAISCYLIKDNFKFVYKKKLYLSKTDKYITLYYYII